MPKEERASFGSKLGAILATAGSAVGLGNIWRFPYMTGKDGGAAFILGYIVCVVILGVPCIISEFIIGRHGAANTARAYSNLSHGTSWKLVGYFQALTGYLITGYYAVVAGWCLNYLYASFMGQLKGDPTFVVNYFKVFCANPVRPIFWTVITFLITHFVIVHGVRNGIEKASKVMMPMLFILLLVVVVISCLLPGAEKGISFLFKPDFAKMNGNVFLDAVGQSFYSLSIAMGCLCTYASYFSRQTNLTKSAGQIAFIDTAVAILAGLMIFPAAFSVGISPDSGPSLIFITLPNVFNEAFSGAPFLRWLISLFFYGLLFLAALTSLISLHEANTAFVYEELHISRKKGAMLVTISCCIIGALCSLSLGKSTALTFGGKPLFDWFDFVTGNIMLPVGGFLMCLFLGWYLPKKVVKDEFTNWGTLSSRFFNVYLIAVRFICPLLILAIFLHQFKVF
ncbi:MAG: sodium-dependent transporter [Prevotella sp.]|jgi:NSS family neurotransmitter:Na+ symporter|nr:MULTISPECIES: sodium-dependent transporter [unclassified Prevotella]MCH3969833.1 sodium-dependent transporter [Prevotella sp.]MCH3984799.1 sodium-dependent transporter [Prevotella sp.]MCH3992571.1 sodium-dependent transporter [Prevotella sp.]MCH4019248.1 sodium-dependent transporter [Prevotella sp.]MCH4099162.1 sodium-dependent transporter [Prevotella sp.]